MAKKIEISFKENEYDMDLYNTLSNLPYKSAQIKDALRERFCTKKAPEINNKNIDNDDDLLCF